MIGLELTLTPATTVRQPFVSIATLILASSQTAAFLSGSGNRYRYDRPVRSAETSLFRWRNSFDPPGRCPLNLYVDPSESTPLPRSDPETAAKNGRSVAEGSIPCAASDPLCKGTTPTPLGSKGAAPDQRRRSSRSSGRQKSHLHAVSSPTQYDSEVLGVAGDDTIVVVRFHAPYCKACKMIAFAYDRFAQKTVASTNPDNLYGVKFVDVEILDQNDYPDLDIPATPYGMIYLPATDGTGLQVVERTPIARRQFSKFKKTLNWYRKGMCDMPKEFFTNPHYIFEDENLIL